MTISYENIAVRNQLQNHPKFLKIILWLQNSAAAGVDFDAPIKLYFEKFYYLISGVGTKNPVVKFDTDRNKIYKGCLPFVLSEVVEAKKEMSLDNKTTKCEIHPAQMAYSKNHPSKKNFPAAMRRLAQNQSESKKPRYSIENFARKEKELVEPVKRKIQTNSNISDPHITPFDQHKDPLLFAKTHLPVKAKQVSVELASIYEKLEFQLHKVSKFNNNRVSPYNLPCIVETSLEDAFAKHWLYHSRLSYADIHIGLNSQELVNYFVSLAYLGYNVYQEKSRFNERLFLDFNMSRRNFCRKFIPCVSKKDYVNWCCSAWVLISFVGPSLFNSRDFFSLKEFNLLSKDPLNLMFFLKNLGYSNENAARKWDFNKV